MENEPKNKIKMKIYEDQTQLQQFVEPEWMKIIRGIIEQKQQSKTMEKTEAVTFCNRLN